MTGWVRTTPDGLEALAFEYGGHIIVDSFESLASWTRGGVTYWAPLPVAGGDDK